MTGFIKKISVFFILFCVLNHANAVEIMKWQRLPLSIKLHVGQERAIFVNRNVRVGIASDVKNQLRIQSANGTVYLLAKAPISPTRLHLQDAETGALILIDIDASIPEDKSNALEPIQIIEEKHPNIKYGQSNKTVKTESETDKTSVSTLVNTSETPIPVVLTRYAAQNLYAPLRTVEPVSGISRVNLSRKLNLQTLLPMLPIQAKAIAAWRLNDYFVTAVLLKNNSTQHIILDPRLLQGDFIAVTFQHPDLGVMGQANDTTVVYLITKGHGLNESLLPAISQINTLAKGG